MNVLVLGANGFIGSQVVRDLLAAGHSVTGLARRAPAAAARGGLRWIAADLARLRNPGDWPPLLVGVDAVVNCAGALQTGARDNLAAVQRDAIIALIDAARQAKLRWFVTISAPLDGTGAATEFLATKREADEHLSRSELPHVILRPAMVFGRDAHGGSALIRALASFPGFIPAAWPHATLRVTGLRDVGAAVCAAIAGTYPPGAVRYLYSERSHSLAEVLALHRRWLGLGEARIVAVPPWLARLVSLGADWLGLLGWRSPLRSTAMRVVVGGVGETAPDPGEKLPASDLESILAAAPAGVHDLWFARLYLLKPIILAVLSLFWIVSGAIALVAFDQTVALARHFGMSESPAQAVALATASADIAIGCAIAVHRTARAGLLASLLFCALYLVAATGLAPSLWLDPLGVLVKIIPAATLAIVALAILPERA